MLNSRRHTENGRVLRVFTFVLMRIIRLISVIRVIRIVMIMTRSSLQYDDILMQFNSNS
jgi:hypothetical protein